MQDTQNRIRFARKVETLHALGPRPLYEFLSELAGGVRLLGSYHPSQQNTFTGRLTRAMFHDVFEKARDLVDA